MKKIITILAAVILFNSAKAQSEQRAIGGVMAGAGIALTASYFIICNKQIPEKNSVYDSPQARKNVYKENAPFLMTAAGCFIITAITFINPSEIHVGKHASIKMGANGIGMAYNLK